MTIPRLIIHLHRLQASRTYVTNPPPPDFVFTSELPHYSLVFEGINLLIQKDPQLLSCHLDGLDEIEHVLQKGNIKANKPIV